MTRVNASIPSDTPFHSYSWWSMRTRNRPSSGSTADGWKRAGSTGVTITSAGLSNRLAMISASHVEITIFRSGSR